MFWKFWSTSKLSDQKRWVVLDTETSSLDTANAQLLSVGAIAVKAMQHTGKFFLDYSDVFYATCRPEKTIERATILIHELGAATQLHSEPLANVLPRLSQYIANAPIIGYHLRFDQAILKNTCQTVGVTRLSSYWVDLAEVCYQLFDQSTRHRGLDAWLERFDISCFARHHALADAVATAELLLVCLAKLKLSDAPLKELLAMSKWHRWQHAHPSVRSVLF